MKDHQDKDDRASVVPPSGFWNSDLKRKQLEEQQTAARRRRCRILWALFCVLVMVGGAVATALVLLDKDEPDGGGNVDNIVPNNNTGVNNDPLEDNGNDEVPTTMSPSPAPTFMPATLSPTALFICNLCGNDGSTDKSPQNLDGLIQRPLVGSTSCGELLELAQTGQISKAECTDWQLYVPSSCNCT
jgi:hypothetical protein